MRKLLVCFILIVFIAASCKSEKEFLICIENYSEISYSDFQIGMANYGDVLPGDTTEYLQVESGKQSVYAATDTEEILSGYVEVDGDFGTHLFRLVITNLDEYKMFQVKDGD